MDFAVYLGLGRTVIYKKGEGIVLNEATKIAYLYTGKKNGAEISVVAVGDAAKRMQEYANQVLIDSPIVGGRIADIGLCKAFLKEIFKQIGGGGQSVLFCIPCSLTSDELDAYKLVAYAAGVSVVEFVPNVIASAIGNGFSAEDGEACVSVFIDEGGTDINIISGCEILSGGTVPVGGADVGNALREHFEKEHKLSISENMADAARMECETLLVNDEVSFKLSGAETETGERRDVWFSGVECYKIIHPIYGKIAKAASLVITDYTTRVLDAVNLSVIYVSGDNRLPTGFREFLTAAVNLDIVVSPKNFNAVIFGAGALLEKPDLIKKIVKAN